jgi:co-chaperonin GroES (HSP10)
MGSRVLVKTVKPWTELDEVEKKGLIVAPDWVKKENTPLPTTGIVLMVGPDVVCGNCGHPPSVAHAWENIPMDYPTDYCKEYQPSIQPGDMVMFPKFSGSDFNIEKEDLRILEAAEIMCTLVDVEGTLTEVAADA